MVTLNAQGHPLLGPGSPSGEETWVLLPDLVSRSLYRGATHKFCFSWQFPLLLCTSHGMCFGMVESSSLTRKGSTVRPAVAPL